jgi:phosphoenolpyruvate---glycerone phosphotransferase subunit DhaK
MNMKKLINNPLDVVGDALVGFEIVHRDSLTVHRNPDFVCRIESPIAGKVALVSGGGSGHEPLHIGFVGDGMLDAAVPGAIFASPSATQIFEAAKAVATDAGVLFVVKNYTGDRLNFQMAADLLAATGIPVELVLVNDDVAVEDSTHTAGRRGTGATLCVEKMAGAAAREGRALDDVALIARKVNEHSRSIGIALSSSTVPHIGEPNFQIGDNEVEFGVGIHGEPGRRRARLRPAAELLAEMADAVCVDLGLTDGDRVVAIVNGLGGSPLLELYVMAGELAQYCKERGIAIERSLVGSFVTSLEMSGCTITLTRVDDELLALWDAHVRTPALSW